MCCILGGPARQNDVPLVVLTPAEKLMRAGGAFWGEVEDDIDEVELLLLLCRLPLCATGGSTILLRGVAAPSCMECIRCIKSAVDRARCTSCLWVVHFIIKTAQVLKKRCVVGRLH